MTKSIYFAKWTKIALMATMAAFVFGCTPKLLPSSNVKATRENKKIFAFLESYKQALEKRSVDEVMQHVAIDFRDNVGSDDPSLELDYLKLKDRLEKYFPRIKEMRIGLFIQHIAKLEPGLFEVIFYFSDQALADLPSGEKWIAKKEVNRMIIRKTKDKNAAYPYEILKGI